MRNPRPAPSHAPTLQRRPEPAAADLAPRDIHGGGDANDSPPAGAFKRVIAAASPAPWWNGIARAWMVAGPEGAPVRLDPQPAAPRMVLADPASPFRPELGFNGPRAVVSFVPPAVKVSA